MVACSQVDRGKIMKLRNRFLLGIAAFTLLSTPVLAGDEVLYQPAAEWVVVPALPAEGQTEGGIVLLADKQVRFEPGLMQTYTDLAYRVATPELMTQLGTLQAQWLPDKGNLTVHRIEIVRDGETVDLLKQGARFEVIRREQGLERRLIDGILTAAVALPGVRVGDVIRMSTTVSLSDQVLGQEVQMAALLPTKESKLPVGRTSVSWPSDMPIKVKTFRSAAEGTIKEQGGLDRKSVV